MNKILILLALVASCFGQGLLPILFGNGTSPLSGGLNGAASFGVKAQTLLTSFLIPAGQTATTLSQRTSISQGAFANIGLFVQFQVTSSATSGNVTVYLTTFTGSNLNAFAGISPSGRSSGGANGQVASNFGFTIITNLNPGQFSILAVITPDTSVLTPALTSNLQAFYAVNATDGSNTAYSQGSANANGFFGALPQQVALNGRAISSITYTLPPVGSAVVTFANVDLTVGASGRTPAVFPVLYGTAARVAAGIRATYVFSARFLVSIYNAVETNVTTTVNTAYNANVGLTAGTTTSAGSSATFNGITYNSQNTVYAGVAYNINVASTANFAALLVQNTTSIAVNTGQRLVWALLNSAGNSAQLLTDSSYDAGSQTVSANVTTGGNYALYATSATVGGTGNGAASMCIGMAIVMTIAAFVF